MKVRGAKKKRKKTHLLQNQFAQCWYLKNVSTNILSQPSYTFSQQIKSTKCATVNYTVCVTTYNMNDKEFKRPSSTCI